MLQVQSIIIIILAFIIPTISMFSPQAMAPIFILTALYPSYIFIRRGQLKSFVMNSKVNKILLVLLVYALISSLWAIAPSESLNLWGRMLLVFISYMALFAYTSDEIDFRKKILKSLFYGIIVALVIANIEIFSDGAISNFFGILYKVSHKFDLVIFNRGANVINIMSWPIVCYLFSEKKYKIAVVFVIAIFLTIIQLDSLSSIIGLAIGSIIFVLVYFMGQKILKILSVFAVCGVFIVAFAAKNLDADKVIGNVPAIPGAASNMRLYIWDYTAKQAYKKPFFGWGFNASRNYPVEKKDYVDGGRSPLPLHPHNNVLQIWLELGAVGLALFAAFLFFSLRQISKMDTPPYVMASCAALFSDYFIIGETGFGIWQNWWVCSGILAMFFLNLERKHLVLKK